ncbi:DUF4157 domain-containing protein [Chitinophaga agrisoli]|uniref:DUF4157 domain-containing protein n=1 Tax=Chitinophaga agrisoli TaxID=2607653 RepID=A0A5B2VKR5_9BACT|nr:DUF4157 domain-containing protein [Chitinophaga agrisoli]KAA2239288.1 DUF4157 domain-containing protein [Chitinophaga agrisoli]
MYTSKPAIHTGSTATPAAANTQLVIGPVDAPQEREADAIAERVIRMPIPSFIQRKCAHCEQEEQAQRKPLASFIQRKEASGNATASAAVTQQIHATQGGGSAMSGSTRSFMESRFGADFSSVRIHTGTDAVQLSRDLNAQAFTVGNDIYFNSGKYAPESTEGKHLLAHELTHTLQQSGGIGRKMIQRMAPCPPHLNATDPAPPGWRPYHGAVGSHMFHCGFRGILEDRQPSPGDPMNECFYDHSGNLVDDSHEFSGCAGTANDYDGGVNPLLHFFPDPGGIVRSGPRAFVESRIHEQAQQAMQQIECNRACDTLESWWQRAFCYIGCNPRSMMP